LRVEERDELLRTSVALDPDRIDSRRFAIRRGADGLELYEGKFTLQVGEDAEFHGFPTAHMPARVLRIFRAAGSINEAEYRRLVKGLG
jgi:hypothetical protein